MRTTVTLDPDVERLIKNEAHAGRKSFKVALNEAVRMAYGRKIARASEITPFVVKARPLGLRPGIDPTRLSEVADEMEIDAFLAVTKKLHGKKR